MSDVRIRCVSGDGMEIRIRQAKGLCAAVSGTNEMEMRDVVHVTLAHEDADSYETIFADPATADAIASALYVAAAQVRKARGEKVEWRHVEGEQRWAGDMACIMGPEFAESGEDFILIARADVPRLIAELGAWLAATEVVK